MRRLSTLLLLSAIFVALLPRCGGGDCVEGAPCPESQAGVTCSTSECSSLVCDGTQVGRVIKGAGDSCDRPNYTCSLGGPGSCGGGYLACDPTQLVFVEILSDGVYPGMPCSGEALVCTFPKRGQGTPPPCQCDGASWVCGADGGG